MLDLARLIFEEQKDVPSLIHKIMMHTQSLLRCERCQVLLVDELHQVRVYACARHVTPSSSSSSRKLPIYCCAL